MKLKLIMELPEGKLKPTIDDMKFLSIDGTTELEFNDWFDEFIDNSHIITKLKNSKIDNEY